MNITRKIPNPMSSPDALGAVQNYSAWTTHSPDGADVVAAIRLHHAVQLSFWDAMVVHSALCLRCSVLWTEDLNDGQQIQGLRVINPFRSHLDKGN